MTWDSEVAALSGLVGWWKLDETSGTNAARSAGSTDGTYTGGYTLAQTSLVANKPSNPAVAVNGSTGYVTIPDHADWSLTTTNLLSIGLVVKPTDGLDRCVIGKGTAANFEWAINRSGDSYYAAVYEGGGGGRATINAPAGTFSNAETHYLVLTLDDTGGDSGILYVNGTAGTTVTTWTGASTNGTSPVDIGRRPDAASYWPGTVDEVFITNTVLSGATVTSLYAAGNAAPATRPSMRTMRSLRRIGR